MSRERVQRGEVVVLDQEHAAAAVEVGCGDGDRPHGARCNVGRDAVFPELRADQPAERAVSSSDFPVTRPNEATEREVRTQRSPIVPSDTTSVRNTWSAARPRTT